MNRSSYPSDLSDDEWELLKPLIPIHVWCGASPNSRIKRNCQRHARIGQITVLNGEQCPMTFHLGQPYMTTIDGGLELGFGRK